MKRVLVLLVGVAALAWMCSVFAADSITNGVAAATLPASGSIAATQSQQRMTQMFLAICVPIVIAAFKRWVPEDKRKWLPIIAPFVGEILANVAAQFGAVLPNGSGAVAGLAGVGVREALDQHKSSSPDGAQNNGSGGAIAAALAFWFVIGTLCFGVVAGCAHLDKTGFYQGDQTLYQTDRVIDGSYDTLHDFVEWEYENRTALSKFPEITKTADKIRLHAQEWCDSAIRLRDAYRGNPNVRTRAELEQGADVLRQALAEVAIYRSKSSK